MPPDVVLTISGLEEETIWVEQEKSESVRAHAHRLQLNEKQKQTISPSGNLRNAARPYERPRVNSSYVYIQSVYWGASQRNRYEIVETHLMYMLI